MLRPELAAVIGAERFLREIKTIANLQHPPILGLIDSGEVHSGAGRSTLIGLQHAFDRLVPTR